MDNEEYLREKQLSSEEIFDGVILHVVKDKISLSNGSTSTREVIRHIGAVCIIPVTDNNEAIVERQYRYPFDEVITEIPAGKLDSKTEDRLEAAKRELREETGITADKWTDIGEFYPAAAYSDERITMYLAQGLHYGEQDLDDDELLNVKKVPLSDLVDEVMTGKIPDSKTQVAILKAARILGV
ncbi:MAG: NUDIX hydrolase [Clostridia bacterium]|nr:NUDIX hydrolase [Clostridia bacterium]